MLPDVSPGAYRLRVLHDASGPGGLTGFASGQVIYERDITVPAEPLPIKISLGGGSVKGLFGEYDEIIAVPHGGGRPTHRERFIVDEFSVAPFLNPGTYTLLARSRNGFFVRVGKVDVAATVTDVGPHILARGGTIRGSIKFRRPCPVPDEIIATGPLQLSFAPFDHLQSFDQFELGGLWPGRWTIAVLGNRQVLATAVADISGTETVTLEIVAEPAKAN